MISPDAANVADAKGEAAQKPSIPERRTDAPGEITVDELKRPKFFSPAGPAGVALYKTIFVLGSVMQGMLFRLRMTGANAVPKTGPFLLIANHQSFLDPPMLGQTCYRRRLHYLAMSGLFKFAPFRWWIKALGAIPIERTGNAGPGLRASLKVLQAGEGLVIFPEGSRSPNGEIQPFKRGVMLLLRKAKVPVVVAGISGAFDAWPIFKKLPTFRPIWIHYTEWQWPEGANENEAFESLCSTLHQAKAVADRGWKNIGGKPVQTRKYKVEDFPD
jgi:1-acyl-sn-glycerol-3-phosphate acyltransferase